MSSSFSFLSSLAVGLVAGTAGALLAITLSTESNPAAGSVAPMSDTASLQQRIADLEYLVQVQATSIHGLEMQRPIEDLQREDLDNPTREEFDRLSARLDALSLNPTALSESASNDRLQYEIANVLSQREEDERRARERVVEEKRAARIQNQVDYWADRLTLSNVQATQFENLMASRDEARRAIGEAVGSGEITKAEAAAPWQQANDEYNTGLSGVLLPQQLEEMQSSERYAK